jgi:hypothetical protein
MKTLNEYATELAKLLKGTVTFLSPLYGIVTLKSGAQITLSGPAKKGWRTYNNKLIKGALNSI